MSQTISNQSQVSFSYEGTTETKTNTSNTVTTTMSDRVSISVDKTSTNECFKPGDIITYFVHITNTGCQCLGRFVVSDNLGDSTDVTYVDGSARLYIGGSMQSIVPTSTSPLGFEISEQLVRDAEMFLQYTVTVNSDFEGDEITNEVCVEAYPCSCRCGNSGECARGSACLTLEKCQYAEVLITKANSRDNICCGDELDYFITLTNTGNIDATNVVVTDTMPNEFNATEVHMENNGVHYQFLPGEYSIDSNNMLTVPVAGGRAILVPSLKPGYDNTTRIRIHGHL